MIGKWCRKSSQRDGTSTISNVHWLYGVLFVFKRPTQFARAMMERRLVVFYWLADTSSSALAGHPPRNRPVDWLCRKARAFPRVPAPTQPTDNPCRSRAWLVEIGAKGCHWPNRLYPCVVILESSDACAGLAWYWSAILRPRVFMQALRLEIWCVILLWAFSLPWRAPNGCIFCLWECFLTDAEYYRPSEATGKQTPVNDNNNSSNNNGRRKRKAWAKIQGLLRRTIMQLLSLSVVQCAIGPGYPQGSTICHHRGCPHFNT